MILTPLLPALALLQVPKTFQELEIAKLKAFHSAMSMREDVSITITAGGQTNNIRRVTEKDGVRMHCTLTGGGATFETFADATSAYVILHPAKQYAKTKIDATRTYNPAGDMLKAEKESLNFRADTGTPVRFASDPPLLIKGMEKVSEGGKSYRKVTASATNKKGRTVKLVQWFLPNEWILAKFQLEGQAENGPVSIKGETSTLDMLARFQASTFIFDPVKLTGYKLVDIKEIGG